MAIVGPKGTHPTLRGWVNAKGELLKCQRISQAHVDEWHGVKAAPAVVNVPDINVVPVAPVKDEWAAEDVDRDGVIDGLESMTKKQLEELGREFGVELDRRKSRAKLLEHMRDVIDSAEVKEESIETPNRAGLIKKLRRGVRKAVTK